MLPMSWQVPWTGHRHPDGWSPSALPILKDESGLNVGNSDVCVCDACSVYIGKAVKSEEKGEPYQLRWLKNKTVSQCCVPTCKSADIKAEKHEFTWEVICSTIGIATIKSPDNLCVRGITSRYIGCLMLSLMHVRPVVCYVGTVVVSFSCPNPKRIESYL